MSIDTANRPTGILRLILMVAALVRLAGAIPWLLFRAQSWIAPVVIVTFVLVVAEWVATR